MGLLDGKRLLITGVLTEASLGYGVAKLAQAEGAEIILTGVGNGMKHTGKTARKLDPVARDPRVRRHRPGPRDVGARRPDRDVGAGSTAPSTRSGSLPRCASAAPSWRPAGTTSRSP